MIEPAPAVSRTSKVSLVLEPSASVDFAVKVGKVLDVKSMEFAVAAGATVVGVGVVGYEL